MSGGNRAVEIVQCWKHTDLGPGRAAERLLKVWISRKKRNRGGEREGGFEARINELKDLLTVDDSGMV